MLLRFPLRRGIHVSVSVPEESKGCWVLGVSESVTLAMAHVMCEEDQLAWISQPFLCFSGAGLEVHMGPFKNRRKSQPSSDLVHTGGQGWRGEEGLEGTSLRVGPFLYTQPEV